MSDGRKRGVGSAISAVIILTFLSKLFGFVRDMVLAYFYGATNLSDAYLVSLTIPEFAFSLITQAIAVGFIPIYTDIIHKLDSIQSHRFVDKVVSIIIFFCAGLILLLNIFPGVFVKLFATGFDEETIAITENFIRITSVAMIFKGLVSVFSAYAQANGEFVRPAIVGMPMDIVVIVSIVVSFYTHNIILAFGALLGYASQFLVLLPYVIKSGYRFHITIHFHDEHIKRMLALFLPVIISVGANQINVLVDRTLASQVAVGGISALNYANKVDNIMENVIVLSIASVMYPTFSKLAAQQDYHRLKGSVSQTLERIACVIAPISVVCFFFAEEIITILFGRGVFDEDAVLLTSSAMQFYSIGMIGVSFRAILIRAFYAIGNIKIPTINSCVSIVINIILNFILSRFMGLKGLALATSISSLVCALLLYVQLNIKLGATHHLKFALSFIKILLATALCAFGGFFLHELFAQQANVWFSLFGIIGTLIIYGIFILVFRVDAAKDLLLHIKKYIFRKKIK